MRPIRYVVTDAGAGDGKVIPLDIYVPNAAVTIQCDVTGTVNYSVEYTLSNVWDPTVTPIWFAHPTAALTGATADQVGSTNIPMVALRVTQASGSGSVAVTIAQQSTQ